MAVRCSWRTAQAVLMAHRTGGAQASVADTCCRAARNEGAPTDDAAEQGRALVPLSRPSACAEREKRYGKTRPTPRVAAALSAVCMCRRATGGHWGIIRWVVEGLAVKYATCIRPPCPVAPPCPVFAALCVMKDTQRPAGAAVLLRCAGLVCLVFARPLRCARLARWRRLMCRSFISCATDASVPASRQTRLSLRD